MHPEYGSPIWLGEGGTGIWNQNGGITNATGWTEFHGIGQLNLNGGVFATNGIIGLAGCTLDVVFNGGTLTALGVGDGAGFLDLNGGAATVKIASGGATINTGTFNIGLSVPIAPSDAFSTGGLTKIGAGDLTLANSNTYTGETNINAGRLFLQAGTPFIGAAESD